MRLQALGRLLGREQAFDRMIERGLADVDAGRVLSHEDIVREIATWSSKSDS